MATLIPTSLDYADESRVAGAQARALGLLQAQGVATAASLRSNIERAEKLAGSFDIELPLVATTAASEPSSATRLRGFPELVAAAPGDAGLHDALGAEERDAALRRLHAVGRRPEASVKLDRSDWIIAGTAGLLAGAADVALVGRSSPSSAELALLPRGVRAGFERLLPRKAVGKLERAYKVPFDASTNRNLSRSVKSLFPKSHRFHSLGHDPICGWIFGVKDVLKGTFTAIGRDGRLVVQPTAEPADVGRGLFVGVLQALETVGGHMLSDVSTSTGLPAPLMPLLQLLQVGAVGDKERTIGDIAWYMYSQGYDFRHYLAGDLVSMIVDAVVRGSWVARRLNEGSSLSDALPDASIPRLRRQLLIGHAVAAGLNAGKIAVQRSPLALNWAQWLVLLRQLGLELHYQATEPGRCASAQDAMLNAELEMLLASHAEGSGALITSTALG